MKRILYLLLAIVLLIMVMPVSTPAKVIAAPEVAQTSFLSVGSWNLDDDMGMVGIYFAANEVNWQVTRAAELQFGYIYCIEGNCTETVDISLAITKKTYTYPQNLDLEAKISRYIAPNNMCTIEQFVRILDSRGAVKKEATNGPYNYCITVPYP